MGEKGRETREVSILKNKSYKKSNELINAKGRGTLLSQKLFAIGMQHLRVDETNNVVATVYGSDLRKIFGSNSGSLYTQIVDACTRGKEGGGTIFDWTILILDEEQKYLKATQVVTDAEFKNGVLQMRYNNSLTKKLIDLKDNYTTLSLSETMMMKSVYSLRLLEILKSAYDYEAAVTRTKGVHMFSYSIIELKLSLGVVTDAGDKKLRLELSKENPDYDMIESVIEKKGENRYPEFKAFNRAVLKPAVDEINEKTVLHVEMEQIKSGKKTSGIRFYVDRKEEEKAAAAAAADKAKPQTDQDDVLDDLIREMGEDFRLGEIRQLCEVAGYDRDKVLAAYRYMQDYTGEISVPVAFMKAAIRDGYTAGRTQKGAARHFEEHAIDFGQLEELVIEK